MKIESLPPTLLQLIKFIVVGASGLLIDFGLTYLLKEKVKLNKYTANSVGFFAAATNNFIINRAWTFSSQDPQVWMQYAKFISFAFIGLIINSVIIWILHDQRKKNFYVAKGLATVIVTLWNFFSNFLFTFR